jgi:hypothetical protein
VQCSILPAEVCPVVVTGAAPTFDAGAQLTKFLDPLPRPAVAQPVASRGRLDPRFCSGGRGDKPADCPPLYHFTLAPTTQKLHQQLPPTPVYGYSSGGPGAPVTYPGPTIEARSNVPIQVRWENRLPRCHMLPLDPTVAEPDAAACELLRTQSRAVTHLHGGRTEAQSDGHPEAVSAHTDRARAQHERKRKKKMQRTSRAGLNSCSADEDEAQAAAHARPRAFAQPADRDRGPRPAPRMLSDPAAASSAL